MVDADFFASPNNGGVAGSFTTTNDSTVLTFGLVAEQSPGDAESNVFKLQIRTGSVSGPVMIESADITVTDAIALGTDIYTSFYEISNRVIWISNTNDYTGNYYSTFQPVFSVNLFAILSVEIINGEPSLVQIFS